MWICTKLYRFRKFLTRFKDFFFCYFVRACFAEATFSIKWADSYSFSLSLRWSWCSWSWSWRRRDATRRRHGHGRLTHICLLRWRAVLKNGHREYAARCGGQRTHRNFLLFFSIKCATSLCPNLRQHRQRLLAPWVTDKLIVFNWTRAAAAGTVLSAGCTPFPLLLFFTHLP